MRVGKYPFCVAGQYVGHWFVETREKPAAACPSEMGSEWNQ